MHSYISRRYPGLPEKIRAYIDLARPFTLLAPALGGLAFGLFALIVSSSQQLDWTSLKLLVYGMVTLVLVTAASNTWNQACEVEVDRINKPDRPIPAGRVDKDEAMVLAVVLYIVAMARATFLPPAFTIGVYILMAITIAYSHPKVYLKKRYLWNNTTMAAARGYVGPWTAWCLFGDPMAPLVHLCCLILAVWTWGAICTKDIPDMPGDRKHGIRTIPVVHGINVTKGVVAVCLLAPFLLVNDFVHRGWLVWEMLWFVVLLPLSLAIIWLLLTGKDVESIVENRVSWVLMYVQFMAMLLSFPVLYLLA